MHERLNNWMSSQPAVTTDTNIAPAEALGLAFNQAVLFLYRPSSAIPEPDESALLNLAQGATASIQLYRRLHRENKLRLFWQAVHNLFAAGTALLHCYAHSTEVRERMSLRSLEGTVHSCSTVLWAMVERFPAAKGTRDAFDVIATAALDSFSTDGPSSDVASGGSLVGDSPNIVLRNDHGDGPIQDPLLGRLPQSMAMESGMVLSPWPRSLEDTLNGQPGSLSDLPLDASLLHESLGISAWI